MVSSSQQVLSIKTWPQRMWMKLLEMPDQTLGSWRRCCSIDSTEDWMLSSRTGIESEIVGSTSFLVNQASSSLQMMFVLALPCDAK